MKLSLFVFLSVVTFVACTVPEVFQTPKGKNCMCRKKECTDVSCEEKNCLCSHNEFKLLISNKDAKYPKKWLNENLRIVQERCMCMQGCKKICSPKEFVECSKTTFDQSYCKFQEFIKGIVHDKGYDHFMADIKKVAIKCINRNCKPTCSGNGDCNPFHIEPKDCGCTKKCIEKFIHSFANDVKNHEAKEYMRNFVLFCNSYYEQFSSCKKNPREGPKQTCYNICRGEIDRALEELEKQLISAVGHCSAMNMINGLREGALDCSIKKN